MKSRKGGDETRDALKAAARRLFARRSIDAVTVRDIVAEAGQKNSGSLHYYFRTKEALIRELVADGAREIDAQRNAYLDRVMADGRTPTLREVVGGLVWPSMGLEGRDEEQTYLRFISELQKNHRDLFLDALEQKWASGYKRCLDLLRTLLADLPPEILNQRLVFVGLYLGATMAAREGAIDGAGAGHHFWGAAFTIENLIDTIEAILREPVSEQTFSRMAMEPPGRNQASSLDSSRFYSLHIRRTVHGA